MANCLRFLPNSLRSLIGILSAGKRIIPYVMLRTVAHHFQSSKPRINQKYQLSSLLKSKSNFGKNINWQTRRNFHFNSKVKSGWSFSLPLILAGIGAGLLLSQSEEEQMCVAEEKNEENRRVSVLKRTFLKYASIDDNGDKYMSLEDLIECLQPHMNISKEKLKILLESIVASSGKGITFKDFVEFDNLLSQPDTEYLIAFKVIDSDRDGFLTKEELKQVIEANQDPESPPFNWDSDWINLYFGASDRLSYKEFTQLIKGLQLEKLRQEFTYLRSKQTGLVSAEEFSKILNRIKLQTPPGMKDISKLTKLAHYDHDGSNRNKDGVNYSQVVAYTNMLLHIPSYGRVLNEAIKLTGKTEISKEEFMRAIPKATTIEITPMECDLIFLFFDLKNDGKLDVSEFSSFASSVKKELQKEKIKEPVRPQKKSGVSYILETAQNFGIGAVAGGIGATAVYPIDLVKTRMQNQRGTLTKGAENLLYKNSLDCFKKVYANEGFLGFYKGLGPQLVGVAPEKAIKLATNDLLKSLFKNEEKGEVYFPLEVLAGGGAGASQVIFTNPLEIVKIRLQVQGESMKKGLLADRQGAISIVKELGFTGLYKGAGACLLRDIPFSAIYFPFYAHLKEQFTAPDGTIHWSQLLLAGAIAGIPAAALVTPADVIKTRLQVKHRAGEVAYDGIVDCFKKVLRDEGPRAFMKGALARVCRSSPQFGVTLLAYELLQKYIFPHSTARPPTNAPVDPGDIAVAFGDAEAKMDKVEKEWFSLFKNYQKKE